MIRLLLVLAFAVLLGSIGREAQSQTPPTPERSVQIPITTDHHGFIIVPALINNTIHARFLLDTGTTGCLIREQLAAKLKIKPTVSMGNLTSADLNGVSVKMVTIKSVRFGGHKVGDYVYHGRSVGNLMYHGQRLRDVLVGGFVLKDGIYDVLQKGQFDLDGVDGILGVNVFSDRAVMISADRHMMVVYRNGSMTPARLTAAGFGSPDNLRLPIFWDTDGGVNVKVALSNGGRSDTVNLTFDTGCDQTDILAITAKFLHIQPLHVDHSAIFLHQMLGYTAIVGSVTVGDLKLSDQIVDYSLDPAATSGSLGIDVLKGYSVLMDFPAKTMYLSPDTRKAVEARP
jgi:hypothetical protein